MWTSSAGAVTTAGLFGSSASWDFDTENDFVMEIGIKLINFDDRLIS